MRAREALDGLYASAVGAAYDFIREACADTAQACGGTIIPDEGISVKVVSANAAAEFGTEKTPPKPRFTKCVYDLEEKLKNL